MNRLLLFAILLLLHSTVYSFGKQSIPIFKDFWLPNSDVVIATFEGEAVSELDLYLWLILTERDPLLARDWREASNNSAVRARLHVAVEDYLQAKLLYPEANADQPQSVLPLERAAHLLATWPTAISYAEQLVRNGVEVSDNDVRYAYLQNSSRFITPELITYHQLDFSYGDGVSLEEARSRAATIREALLSGSTVEQLLADHEEWFSAETRLKPTYDQVSIETLEDASRAILEKLLPGQISPLQETLRYVRLLQLISKTPSSQLPLEQVQENLKAELFPVFYRQQFGLSIVENVKSRYPMDRSKYLQFMEPEMIMLKMGDFELTTAEFLQFVDEFPTPTNDDNREDYIGKRADETLQGEGMIQSLQEANLLSSGYYPRAKELAEMLVARKRFLSASLEQLTELEIEEYLAAHLEELAPPFDYTIWAFSATIPSTFVGSPGELAELQRSLYQEQSELIIRARQLLEERVSIGSAAAYALPEAVMNRLLRTATNSQYLTLKNIGGFTPEEAELNLGLLPEQLMIGQFSGPRQFGDEMVSYYVAETRGRPAPPKDQLWEMAKQKKSEEKRLGTVLAKISEAKSQGTLRYNLP